jgi:hypothetical protein
MRGKTGILFSFHDGVERDIKGVGVGHLAILYICEYLLKTFDNPKVSVSLMQYLNVYD